VLTVPLAFLFKGFCRAMRWGEALGQRRQGTKRLPDFALSLEPMKGPQ
jgi:hypothetical protein